MTSEIQPYSGSPQTHRQLASEKPLLLLIDGHSIVHRAYHAIAASGRPMTLKTTGESVNGVFGFISMLIKVLREYPPSHIAISFDRPVKTFRHDMFEEYKAGRETPSDLVSQFHYVKKAVEAMGLPVYELDGYEADDVLGALSLQASQQGIDVLIVTGDADATQLVSEKVKVLTPGRSLGEVKVYDEEAVRQKYGISPSQMADFKALKGDPSDGIPNIPGIGDKTAAGLLQKFDSLDSLYLHLEQVQPEKLRKTLEQYKDMVLRNRALTGIVTSIPVKLDLEACRNIGFDRNKFLSFLRDMEFVDLARRVPESLVRGAEGEPAATAGPAPELLSGNYHTVYDLPSLHKLVEKLSEAGSFVVDTESSGLDIMSSQLIGLSFCIEPGEAWYIPVGHMGLGFPSQIPLEQVKNALKPILENLAVPKAAHNSKFDMSILANHDIYLKKISFDTMIAAHLLGERTLSLKSLAFTRLNAEMSSIETLIGKGAKQISMAQVHPEQVTSYACADADACLRLKGLLEKDLLKAGLINLFNDVEMPLLPVLHRMERHGLCLDLNLFGEMSRELGNELSRLEKMIYEEIGHEFNINSPKQLGQVLFVEQRILGGKKTKEGYSTEASILEGLKEPYPVVRHILEYRTLQKLKSTYVDSLPALINPVTGRVHTSLNQTVTATGRLSSSEPNLQNIPVRGDWGYRIRKAFIVPPPFIMMSADYSQIDLRVLAHLSQDSRLIAAFLADEDIHAATASEVFGVPISQVTPDMRRVAKTVNFGVIYGMSEYGLEQATEFTREESARFISAYLGKYVGVKDYIERTKQEARMEGFVQTLLGRRRYLAEINNPNRQIREAAERMAINMPVQGTSADIIKIAMIRLQSAMDHFGLRSKMLLQIHDELLFEVPPEEETKIIELIQEHMPFAIKLSVPLKIDIKKGSNWAELK